MSNARCITAFSQGGYSARVGDLVDTTSYLYSRFPTYFAAEADVDYLEAGGTLGADLHFSGTLGPVLHATSGTLSYRVTVNAGGTLLTEQAT